MNIKATYHFVQFRFEKEPLRHHVPCEVLKETDKSYYIKLLAPNVRGHQYGDCIWAGKDMVTFPKAEVDTLTSGGKIKHNETQSVMEWGGARNRGGTAG